MRLGQIGIWRTHHAGYGGLEEIEGLGYGALWLGGSPSVAQAREYLERTRTLTIATGILNIWKHEPGDVAAARVEVAEAFPGRFLLGIGVGHPEATRQYAKPLTAMREFFDGLAAGGVPREEMVAAALGPKMLDLAAERSLGTHPYFTPVEHTRYARERVGPDKLVAPELAVVVEADPETGRRLAREYADGYLKRSNYTRNLLKFGFTEADIADTGSDRLIDAVIPHGTPEAVAETVRAHLQPLGHGGVPLEDYRALAAVLL
jgi:probable F420-dependent oxidoreductase